MREEWRRSEGGGEEEWRRGGGGVEEGGRRGGGGGGGVVVGRFGRWLPTAKTSCWFDGRSQIENVPKKQETLPFKTLEHDTHVYELFTCERRTRVALMYLLRRRGSGAAVFVVGAGRRLSDAAAACVMTIRYRAGPLHTAMSRVARGGNGARGDNDRY